MATFDEFYKSLDSDSGIRGKQFERFVKWFLKIDPVWKSQVEEVWLWDEYPERWGRDCGIDLVFKHKNGKTWAVQSKCYSPEHDISKSEIDSFLSESSDARIDGRLLIASTDGIGRNALQVIERQEKQVVCCLLEQFRQSEIEFPSSPDDLNQGHRKKRKTPRTHQREAIDAVEEGLKIADRGQLLMACGTGKTLTALWIKERLKAKRSLVLVPSLSLLSQILKDWTAAASEPFDPMCVCSDKSVASRDKVEDDWIANTSEIGSPVTSDSEEIKEFLKRDSSQVVFSTYQSSPLIAQAQKDSNVPEFDIAFADEAHRCAGKVSDAFGCVLDHEQIRSKKRLFLTATPRVLSKQIKSKAKENEIEVVSMDDHSVFGNVLYQLNFSKAIDNDLLSDYRVVVVGVDDPMVEERIRNRELLATSNKIEIDAETLASHIALAKATKDFDLQRVITFHSRIKSARDFAEQHQGIINWMPESDRPQGETSVNHVSGNMTTKERNRCINQLKNLGSNERGILANARCLSEGVDVPNLNGIAFIDPRKSQVDIIQAVGRAIRKSEDKSFGTIVIPVYLADVENIEDEILASRFKDVWKIILALKSQDDSLLNTLDKLRVELGGRQITGEGNESLERIIFDLPKRIRNDFSKSIRTLLITNTSDDWLEKFGQLKAFKLEHGHTSPNTNDSSLGAWCGTQRKEYKKSKLSKDRTEFLNSINFIWDLSEEEWQTKYDELKAFKMEHGHVSPKIFHPSLGLWCGTQRQEYKKGKLSKDRTKFLNSINFIWDPLEEEWQTKYKELKAFKIKNGNVNPSRRDPLLGNWILVQRRVYKKGKLSKEKVELLNSINIIWDPLEEEWQEKYDELKAFKLEHSHASPKISHPSLGSWCSRQRQVYKKGKLPKDRTEFLNSINFQWDPSEEEWQKKFNELKAFKLEHSHASPKISHPSLGTWCCTQRYSYNKGKLNQQKIELLDSINFKWDRFEAEWQEKFKELKAFKFEHGHTSPNTKDGSLGTWCGTQRQEYKKGKLSKEKIELLISINFKLDPFEEEWQEKFKELKAFQEQEGHVTPSQKGSSLGTWCSAQRRVYKKGKLPQKRINLLESIGFKWTLK